MCFADNEVWLVESGECPVGDEGCFANSKRVFVIRKGCFVNSRMKIVIRRVCCANSKGRFGNLRERIANLHGGFGILRGRFANFLRRRFEGLRRLLNCKSEEQV